MEKEDRDLKEQRGAHERICKEKWQRRNDAVLLYQNILKFKNKHNKIKN